MAYFVTGATGFIGRYLVERLLARGERVYVLVRPQSMQKFEALRAWRAVGTIMRETRDPATPCHRVIAAGGALGGYGGNLRHQLLDIEAGGDK